MYTKSPLGYSGLSSISSKEGGTLISWSPTHSSRGSGFGEFANENSLISSFLQISCLAKDFGTMTLSDFGVFDFKLFKFEFKLFKSDSVSESWFLG